MATFTFDAIRIGYDADGLSNAFDVIEGSVLFFGDPTRIDYVFEADRSATLSVFGPQPGGPGYIDGGHDDAVMDGGTSDDYLRGGNGVDTFVFEDIEEMGRDRILDWEDGRDLMDFSSYGFSDFATLHDLSYDVPSRLRIQLSDDDWGNQRVVFMDHFLKADFDASDVILA